MTNAYLDTLTYTSHGCVAKAEIDAMYEVTSGYPSQAHTGLQFRLSHKLIAISSMIHSIERKCQEAWNIGKLGSCVPSVPYFPHCHTSCAMTWNMGPGGVGRKGMSLLNHHIPSPTLALGQLIPIGLPMKNKDVGCGAH